MTKTNPEHYQGGIEPWDFIVSQKLSFLEGNIIKYVVRAGNKPGESRLDDLAKAATYLRKLIQTTVLEHEHNDLQSTGPDGSSDSLQESDGPTHRSFQPHSSFGPDAFDIRGVPGSDRGSL